MSIEEWQIQEIQKAIKEADAGLFASDEDMMKLKKKWGVTTSSGNIFQDMGFDNADQYLAKVKLASRINDLIETRGLTQKEAGEILQLRQPKVSALINGDLDGFSMDRLFAFLARFDQNVQIIIKDKPKSSRKPAVLNIAFA